jgi:hypothetical protein
MVCKHGGSHCKSDKSADRSTEKLFPEMFSKVLQSFIVSLTKGTALEEMLCK